MEPKSKSNKTKRPDQNEEKTTAKKSKNQVTKSPGEKYQDLLNLVITREKAIGCLQIQGPFGADSDEEEEEELELTTLTEKQVRNLRDVILTKKRNKEVEKYFEFATGGDSGGGFVFSNTSTGNNVIFGMPDEIKKALKRSSVPGKFDALLGLTYNLFMYDSWMSDNECYDDGTMKKAVLSLASAWKNLLSKHTNEELGIDAEVTRPGVESLLDQFAEKISSSEAVTEYGNYKFNWR